jgi:hypothetical protein
MFANIQLRNVGLHIYYLTTANIPMRLIEDIYEGVDELINVFLN